MNKKELINNTKITILFNLTFLILEIIGGFLTNSISIISSAIHDFSDSITVCLENLFNNLFIGLIFNDFIILLLTVFLKSFITSISSIIEKCNS